MDLTDSDLIDEEYFETDGGGQPQTPEQKPETKPEAKPEDTSVHDLRKQTREQADRIRELEQSTQYWHSQAKRSPEPRRAEPEPEPDVNLVEAFASNDPKQLKSALSKLGFVSKADVDDQISRTRTQLAEENKLFRDYPEMQNKGSEFFKTASKHYNALLEDDPSLQGDPKGIKMAARLARTEMEASQRETTDERNRRVGSQSGDKGAPATRGTGKGAGTGRTEASTDLSPLQKQIIKNLRDAGSTLTEEGYRKRAGETGVNMSGRRR